MTYTPAAGFSCTTPITISPAISDGTWYLDTGQRQKATVNAIWQMPHGFQLSGIFLYGDQGWATPAASTDICAGGAGSARVQAPFAGGARVQLHDSNRERGGWMSSPQKPRQAAVDQEAGHAALKSFTLGGRVKLQGIAELFNVLNTVNYDPTKFVTSLGNLTNYSTPGASANIQCYPRMAQFGFRATF